MRIIFSGGGTGGHIYPAIAVAALMRKKYPDTEILFIGAKDKIEMTKVPKAGFDIEGLWISGFQRKLTYRNALFPFKLLASLVRARRVIREFKPEVVAGFGGYASGAALWVAGKMGIKTLIQEQNSYPGVTNKILGKVVDRVCIAYRDTARFFDEDKVVLTGNPVREMSGQQWSQSTARVEMSLDAAKPTVLVIGGSLGARSLNRCLRDAYNGIRERSDVQWIWQCGSLYWEEYRHSSTAGLDHVHIMSFIEDMDVAYAAADIVVSRAGALTLAELMVLGKPSILVPSPNVAEDHQSKNAKALVDKNAAVFVKDDELNALLLSEVYALLKNARKREQLSGNIKSLSDGKATERIVDEIIRLVSRD